MLETKFSLLLISLFIFSLQYKIDKERIQLIDDTIDSLVKTARLKTLGLIITNKDKTIHQKMYGETDKIDAETSPFVIGSITKSFTALAILQLNIPLNQTIDIYELNDYIDEDFAKKTTVSELLNSTSGLARDEFIDQGTKGKFSYSNCGFILLGKIIEKVSHKTYSEYIQKNIFEPLNMTHSKAEYNENIVDSYDNFFGFITKYTGLKSEYGDGLYVPAGYISLSVEDMGHYLRYYLDDKNKEYISQITKETVEIDKYSYYGMGMEIYKNDFYTKYEHTGGTYSFLSDMIVYPQLDMAFFITINTVDAFCTSTIINVKTTIENLIVYGSLDSILNPSFSSTHFTIDIIIIFILAFPLTYLIITIVRKIKRKKYMWFFEVKGKIIFAIDLILLIILPIILIVIFNVSSFFFFYRNLKDFIFALYMFCSCLMFNFLIKLIYVFVYNKYLDKPDYLEKLKHEENVNLELTEDKDNY